MKYEVRLNGNYMNVFATYGEAVDLRDRLLRQFGTHARVEIISLSGGFSAFPRACFGLPAGGTGGQILG